MKHLKAISALDKKIRQLPDLSIMQRPHKGWIKAARQALGMSALQLAKRLGVSQPRISVLERAEYEETVTLASLRKAAEALDCALVYSFIPKKSFENILMSRATQKAQRLIKKVDHTMALENQNEDHTFLKEEIESLARKLIEEQGSRIWDED